MFFIFDENQYFGGKVVSFLEDSKSSAFQNPRFPTSLKYQPKSFCEVDKQGIHKKTKQIMVKIIDTNTQEVIKEVPPEKILDMVASMMERAGLIVDRRG